MAYRAEFTVGDPGAPVDGQTSYYNSLLAGAQFRVFREGLYQYQVGANRIFDTTSGTIFFIPALYSGERIKIII
jgi:hypothetical protein